VKLTLAYRRWCWSHSNAVFHGGGKLRALRNILAELPTFHC
jgi:hypothetical protein